VRLNHEPQFVKSRLDQGIGDVGSSGRVRLDQRGGA
jgi:hypothetical protein